METVKVQIKEFFAVIGNTDLTEGRGKSFVKYYCETLATAKRLGKGGYVQGFDCPIEPCKLYRIDGKFKWLGPVKVEGPNETDRRNQQALDERQEAVNQARALGLSEEQIKLIRGS